MTSGSPERQDLAVAVLTSVIDIQRADLRYAWDAVGLLRATHLLFMLIGRLLQLKLQNAPQMALNTYAAQVHQRAGSDETPPWLIEGVARSSLGERELLDGLDSEYVLAVAGFVARELVADLDLTQEALSLILLDVSSVPTPGSGSVGALP